MKNSNSFIKLSCIISALLIACIVNLKAQDELIGYTFVVAFGNSSYYMSNCEATWEEANDAAIEMGGYLATLTNGWEIYNLGSIIESWYFDLYWGDELPGIWIGLRGENGIYEWANGEPGSAFYWSSNTEPVYADGAVLIAPDNWDDYDSWFSYPVTGEAEYLLEFPYTPNCNNPNKTYVCHNGNTICVNSSAVQSHLNHGDYAGPCGPCNTYAMQALHNDKSEIAGHSLQTLNTLSEPHDQHGLIQDGLTNQIHIYPNPASDQIHVILPEVIHDGTIRILSYTGQEMHTLAFRQQQAFNLDLSDYIAGLYLIDVRSANGHYQKRIVKM